MKKGELSHTVSMQILSKSQACLGKCLEQYCDLQGNIVDLLPGHWFQTQQDCTSPCNMTSHHRHPPPQQLNKMIMSATTYTALGAMDIVTRGAGLVHGNHPGRLGHTSSDCMQDRT